MKSATQIACLSPSAAALGADGLPSALTLLRWGENQTLQGLFIVNERTVRRIAGQVEAGIFDRVLLDFQHNSEKGHPNYQPPPRHHAAVGKPYCSPDLGLGMAELAWTPYGKDFARDYPDLSPAVTFDPATREVTGLRSAALCPQGATVNGIAFFSAEADDAPADDANNPNGDTQMEELLKAAQAAIKALTERIDALEAKLGKAETSATAAMSAAEAVKTDFAALSAEATKNRKLAVIDQAKREGKVVQLTDSAVAALSVEDLTEHCKALKPGRVPLKAVTPETQGAAALDADSVVAQYNAISDPNERAEFFRTHSAALGL